jgi:hypothetical protein
MNLLALAYNNGCLNHNWDFNVGEYEVHRFKCGSLKQETKTTTI